MNRGTLLLALLPVLALVHSAHSKVPVGMNLEVSSQYAIGCDDRDGRHDIGWLFPA